MRTRLCLLALLAACATAPSSSTRHPLPSAPGPVRGETIARLGGPGTLAPERVWEAARARILGLERCYAAREAARPGLAGVVVTALQLGPDGRVSRGAIRQEDVGDEGLLDCVRGFFRALRVSPAPQGGPASFELALRFDPFALVRPEPEPEPQFDANIVASAIRANIRDIQRCYERQLRAHPDLAGRVVVQFTIAESGRVSAARITENATGSPEVGACVINVIRRFVFEPGPVGGTVNFSYPFVFAPQS